MSFHRAFTSSVARDRHASRCAWDLVRAVGRGSAPRGGEARAIVRERLETCARAGVALPRTSALRGAIELVLTADRALQESVDGSQQSRLAAEQYRSAIRELGAASRRAS